MILCSHSESRDCVSSPPLRPVGYHTAATMSGQAEITPLLRQRKPVSNDPNQEQDDASRSDGAQVAEEERDPAVSWANPFTWPASVYIALLLASAVAYWSKFLVEPSFDTATPELCRSTFNYTFRVNAARSQIERLSSHSWEYGTGVEAMLELLEPERTVLAEDPFPADKIQKLPLKKIPSTAAKATRRSAKLPPSIQRNAHSALRFTQGTSESRMHRLCTQTTTAFQILRRWVLRPSCWVRETRKLSKPL